MIYFICAVLTLFAGHYVKMLRWKLLISVYEKPQDSNLLQALSLGYLINLFIPFRLGDIARAIYSGRKMKSGISFSLATIIVDRYLDILAVGFLFVIFYFVFGHQPFIVSSIKFYSIAALALFFFSVLAIKYSKYPKKIIKSCASIFNLKIEYNLLFLFWAFISSFKDMYKKTSHFYMVLYTIIMWAFYLSSYYLISQSSILAIPNQQIHFLDTFGLLFSSASLDYTFFNWDQINTLFFLVFSLYIGLSLLLLWAVSLLQNKIPLLKKQADSKTYINLLPHLHEEERLKFLEDYFSGDHKNYFDRYLEINRDIRIIQDYSAGSNATTMLCMNEQTTFFRKYAFGADADKLQQQIDWIKNNTAALPLPEILNNNYGDGYCLYDMPYSSMTVGLFNYVHSNPQDKSWQIVHKVLETLKSKLYDSTQHAANPQATNRYIQTKVNDNLNKIMTAKPFKELLQYDELVINNQKYRNLKQLLHYFSETHLTEIFKNDSFAEIHGDLTIENIVCSTDRSLQEGFYLIDPNTGNVHESPYLDYAKLLQSLHGGYEFLMKTYSVNMTKNEIHYLSTKSLAYEKLYQQYHHYLTQHFSEQDVKSIYYHELIHWLRLMPYKINNDTERCVMFYAGFIIVLNDIVNRYEK